MLHVLAFPSPVILNTQYSVNIHMRERAMEEVVPGKEVISSTDILVVFCLKRYHEFVDAFDPLSY